MAGGEFLLRGVILAAGDLVVGGAGGGPGAVSHWGAKDPAGGEIRSHSSPFKVPEAIKEWWAVKRAPAVGVLTMAAFGGTAANA